ncbi:MAG: helix-turn-helix transcriptional regulator [Bradymonadaceae bacterium]
MGARNLASLRNEREMTQEELADACGVSRMTVYRWEKEGLPPKRVDQVAQALNIDRGEVEAVVGVQEAKGAADYVRSGEDASDWRDAVVAAVDDFELRALLMSMASKDDSLLDRRFWVVVATLEEVAEAVNADQAKVEELWPDVLASPFVERIGSVEWCLALRFPDND